jgi:Tol biopolymer transport system component
MPARLAVALSLLTLILVAERAEAKPESQRDGRISFIVGESGDTGPSPRLIVMDADGTNPRVRLGYVYHASLSPNGRLIAYDPAGSRDTRVIAADGPLRDRLLVRNGRSADWSPTGAAVAFERGSAIWVKNLHSRAERRVVRNAEWPDWSPDAKKLAFIRLRPPRDENSDVWVVDLASKRTHRLIRNAGNVRWSANGHWIAFERELAPRKRVSGVSYPVYIYVARADGTKQRRLAEGESPAWSPDGRELAFTDGRRIFRVRLDGRSRRVVYDPKYFLYPRFLDWAR